MNADLPSIAVVPSRVYASFLKEELLRSGRGFFNLRFLTVGECWKRLNSTLGPARTVPDRETLHLLLSSAAESADSPSAAAAARAPAPLMKALDQVSAAGHSWADLGIASLRKATDVLEDLLSRSGMTLAQEVDRQLIECARRSDPVFGPALICGFDGSHWSIWNLLNAVAAASNSAVVCLHEPRLTCGEADQVWIGSWEQEYGEAERKPEDASSAPFADLADAMEIGGGFDGKTVSILVGDTIKDQAAAIVGQAIRFLADDDCRRLGIVFPGPSPLSRETSRLLTSMKIGHHDTLGYCEQGTGADSAWLAWIETQKRPRLGPLFRLLELCPKAAALFERSHDELVRDLSKSYSELMTDEIKPLCVYANVPGSEWWPSLPARGTPGEFTEAACAAVMAIPGLGGAERERAIRAKAACLPNGLGLVLSRDKYLGWLTEISSRVSRTTAEPGSHPYSRVHLVSYIKAEWQTWTHTILAGLNSNSWPPTPLDPPFLSQDTVDRLNAGSLKSGRHGEGDVVVKPGKAYLLGPAHEATLVNRRFYNIVESTTQALAATASRSRPDNPNLKWNPSELLVRLHGATGRSPLSDSMMDSLQARTSEWLSNIAPSEGRKKVSESRNIEETAKAYASRRDGKKPFGVYEFGLSKPPNDRPVLSCTDWEAAVSAPEIVWMSRYLGVSEPTLDPAELPWRQSVGLWVHSWLRACLADEAGTPDSFVPVPTEDVALRRARKAANFSLKRAANVFRRCGSDVPEWWRAIHAQAVSASTRLARALARARNEGWTEAVAEWWLPEDAKAQLASEIEIPLRGRIDLLLRGASGMLWVVDYKTGSIARLTPPSVSSGNGLQVLLYALAVRQGANRPGPLMALATPDGGFRPVANADELASSDRVRTTLKTLAFMNYTGRFGMKGQIRPEFGSARSYPLATTGIDARVLEAKWALTFGEATAG